MKAAQVRVAAFTGATIEDLQNTVNDFLSGVAIVGPPAFAAEYIGEAEFLDLQYRFDGATYTAIVVYTK